MLAARYLLEASLALGTAIGKALVNITKGVPLKSLCLLKGFFATHALVLLLATLDTEPLAAL